MNTAPISFGDFQREIELQKYGEDAEMFYEKCLGEIRRFAIKTIVSQCLKEEDRVNISPGLTSEDEEKLGERDVMKALVTVCTELRKMGFIADVVKGPTESGKYWWYFQILNVMQLAKMQSF